MYQVIARKWRPQTFEDVTGQEAITRTLTNALEHQRLHHAYIFSGARGVGKTTTARLLAKAVNCHKSNQPTATPCAIDDATACVSCKEVAEGRSIDVLEIDAASNTGVDNVRDAIINTVGIRPARDKYKVFIIDEVHMLSTQAFNALLKTLEEPPPNVLFIMATTEAHKIPDTILSRSQQFEFRTIATNKIFDRLKKIAEVENVEVDVAALFEIARAGEGSMRDAQSAFDQTISFSDGRITAIDVEHALGLAGSETLTRTVRAIAERQSIEVLKIVDDLSVRGHDFRNFCRDLLAYLRDLLVIKVGANDSETEADAARNESLKQQRVLAEDFSESDLVRFFHSLTATERDLRESSQPRYQLELGLIKLIEMRRLAALDDILARLVRLEQNSNGNAPPSGASSNSKASSPGTTAGGKAATPKAASSLLTSNTSLNVASDKPAVDNSLSTVESQTVADLPDSQSVAASPDSLAVADSSLVADLPPPTIAATSTANTVLEAKPQSEENSRTFAALAAEAPFDVAPHRINNQTSTVASQSDVSPVRDASPVRDRSPVSLFGEASATAPSALKLVAPLDELRSAATQTVSAPTASDSVAPSNHPDAQVRQLIELLEARRPFIAMALEKACTVRFEASELIVEFEPSDKHLIDNLKGASVKVLCDACREITNRNLGLRLRIADGDTAEQPLTSAYIKPDISLAPPPDLTSFTKTITAPQSSRSPQTSNLAATNSPPRPPDADAELWNYAESHPTIQKLLQTFRGQIVDVRRTDANNNDVINSVANSTSS